MDDGPLALAFGDLLVCNEDFAVVVDEDGVGMLAHQFDDELEVSVDGGDADIDDAVEPSLADKGDFAVEYPLAKGHAKGRRVALTRGSAGDDMHPVEVGIGADEEREFFFLVDGEDDCGGVGLDNFLNPSADKGLKFGDDGSEGYAVEGDSLGHLELDFTRWREIRFGFEVRILSGDCGVKK